MYRWFTSGVRDALLENDWKTGASNLNWACATYTQKSTPTNVIVAEAISSDWIANWVNVVPFQGTLLTRTRTVHVKRSFWVPAPRCVNTCKNFNCTWCPHSHRLSTLPPLLPPSSQQYNYFSSVLLTTRSATWLKRRNRAFSNRLNSSCLMR